MNEVIFSLKHLFIKWLYTLLSTKVNQPFDLKKEGQFLSFFNHFRFKMAAVTLAKGELPEELIYDSAGS